MAETRHCDACGEDHSVISSLPDQPIPVDALRSLTENENITYTGPTVMNVGGGVTRTPMVVIQTQERTKIVSFYEDSGAWLVTLSVETPDEEPEKYGALVNEMATQVIEAGYKCAQAWMDDGEPGGSAPV